MTNLQDKLNLPLDVDHICNLGNFWELRQRKLLFPYGGAPQSSVSENRCPACCYLRGHQDATKNRRVTA